LERNRVHRFRPRQVASWSTSDLVGVLRVLLVPERAEGLDARLGVELDGERVGLHVRNAIACPTDGAGASVVVRCARSTWVDLLCCSTSLDEVIASGALAIDPDTDANTDTDVDMVRRVLGVFDLESLAASS
jgi:hypothetical protein